jgi:predicted CDP-diglyceride synthetase/phosphatidate cytidylyltransferase
MLHTVNISNVLINNAKFPLIIMSCSLIYTSLHRLQVTVCAMAFIRGGYIPGAELYFISILILKETKELPNYFPKTRTDMISFVRCYKSLKCQLWIININIFLKEFIFIEAQF